MFPLQVSSEMVHSASRWHGGQWSALYKLACNAKILSYDHMCSLRVELHQCIQSPSAADDIGLQRLFGVVDTLWQSDVGAPVEN